MNASSNTLEALQTAVASPRMYSCTKLDEQLAHTHRRLLMRLGSGRDTLVWQTRIDAPASVVWQAAASSVETFFSHLSDVERVKMMDDGPVQEGSRYVIHRSLSGYTNDRVGEILVLVPGAMLTASDIDPEDASPAGALPSLHSISVHSDPDHPGRSVLHLMGVTLGCYNMWMLPAMKAQAASISDRVEQMLRIGRVPVYRLTPGNQEPVNSNSFITPEKTMQTIRSESPTPLSASKRHTWTMRLAMIVAALLMSVVAHSQQSSGPDISAVYQALDHRGPYQYDMRYERIWLADEQTGRTFITLTVDASESVVLRGVIGRTGRMNPQTKSEVMTAIGLFNFRSNGGLMSYDEASGELRITRTLSISSLTPTQTADEAVKFTDFVREEARKFAEAQAAGVPYCALLCNSR